MDYQPLLHSFRLLQRHWKRRCDVKECPADPPKKCFKGVESFLRRVAFNLGNSPSQTEVKIISCIPIDVTDLQQKINHLERQLEEACRPGKSCYRMLEPPDPFAVHTAVTEPAYLGGAAGPQPPPRTPSGAPAAPADTCTQLNSPENCARKKSAVSLTIPLKTYKSSQGQREPRSSCTSNDTEPRKKILFKKYRKPRNDSPLVYYAQTTSSPFTNYRKEIAARRELKRMDAKVDEPYVGSLLRKQYAPELHVDVEQWAGASSQVSAPVCRDQRAPWAPAPAPAPCVRDADACSCCRGRFYDIDRDCLPFLDNSLSTNMHRNVDSGNIFYNSTYYDIFPVKEKEKRESDKYKKWEHNFQFDDNCFRKNYRTNIEARPVLISTKLTSAQRCANKNPGKLKKWRDSSPKRLSTTESTGNNTIVECGDIYMKRSCSKKQREKVHDKTVKLFKDVECLTNNVNDTECQTESSKNMRPAETGTLDENQTETTLSQIKSILQSVLSHVKTNNLIKQTDSKEKKDAIVQKELQPNSPPVCPRLASIYTYSPFAMDGYAPAACPPVMLPLHPAAPTAHFKYINNVPVFTQHSTPPHQYTGCYNPRPQVNSQLIQTSANTLLPVQTKRSKQTEDLIKEIYGSIAKNIPESQTPNSDSNDTRPRNVSTNAYGDRGDPVISNVMTMCRQEGPRAASERAQARAGSTAATSPATSSSSSETSDEQRSAHGAGDQGSARDEPRPARYDSAATIASERRARRQPDTVDSESPSEDVDSASDHTVVPTPTKHSDKDTKKPSIFKKMFGSVFSRRRKVKFGKAVSSVAASEGDSDEYQTVYSQTVERPKRVSYAPEPRSPRAAPYMEQEYRREWHEQLMFQRPRTKYSSEQAPTRPRSMRTRPPGIYFHKCQARPALIEQTSSDPEQAAPPPRPRKNVSLKVSNRKMSFPKKHSPKIKCAEQWTRLMLGG